MTESKAIVAVDVPGDLMERLQPLVRSHGIDIRLCGGVKEAIESLGDTHPRAILLGPNGAHHGRAHYSPFLRAAPDCPLILLGRDESREQVLRALRSGVWMYYRQPYSAGSLAETLNYTANDSPSPSDVALTIHSDGRIEFRLRSKVSAAERVTQILRDLEGDVPEEIREKTASALWEMLLNAVEHGAGKDPDIHVQVVYERTATELRYRIKDPGQGFLQKPLPHAAEPQCESLDFPHLGVRSELGLRPGGFGILIARQLVDELSYNQRGNEVLLVKKLPA